MDNLAKCAFLAMQNRMSYGKYMATFKPPKPPKLKVKKQEMQTQPEKLCLECGGQVVQKKGVRPQKFCCIACCRKWHARNKNRKANIQGVL